MTELTKAKRRIRQLENCLQAVLLWCSDQEIELTAHGADNAESYAYRELCRLTRRIERTTKNRFSL